MRLSNLILIVLASAFFSCQKTKIKPASLQGTWESIGSGWILEIKDTTSYAFYDITSISCLPNRSGNINEIKSSLKIENDTLSLLKGVITYKFVRMQELPNRCTSALNTEKQNDLLYNFEVFAETIKEHYAFMELNRVDWDSLYNKQKDKLGTNPNDIKLYQTIEETLAILNDNHAFLEADDTFYTKMDSIESQANEAASNEQSLPEYGDFQVAEMVAQNHLNENLTKDSWLLKWGKMNDSIGFIQVKAMWLYADLNMDQSLIDSLGFVDAYVTTFHQLYEGNYIEKEKVSVAKIMDNVMHDLNNMKSIVIDVRFNGGGQDAVSFEILGRFISGEQQVATQKLRYGNQFSPILSLTIKGTNNAYIKPVYILTSPQTGSAAEAFSIATMNMKNVKRIGSPTSGAMSTALEKTLPNGWVFSTSNEVYMDNQGNNYENIGVPVDYSIEYPNDRQDFFRSVANDLKKDEKTILTAIESLQKNN